MPHRIPRVAEGELQLNEAGRRPAIRVGSAAWFAWLRRDDAGSFAFVGPGGTFTARREHRARGGAYWTAYRKHGGRLHRVYLGKADQLSLDRMDAAAAALAKPGGKGAPAPGAASHRRSPAEHAPRSPDDPAVLTTKLSIPPPRAHLVPRRRLIERLDEGFAGKLTLISAPAGFGKTTSLAAWHAARPGAAMPLAWLSLEDSDNDPVRFWRHVVTAVDRHR